MACRATDGAATAATDGGGPRRPKTHQRCQCDSRSPPTARHWRTARILDLSPVLSEPAVRTHSKIEKKPPPAIIPGNESRRYHEDGMKAP